MKRAHYTVRTYVHDNQTDERTIVSQEVRAKSDAQAIQIVEDQLKRDKDSASVRCLEELA